MTLPTHIHVLVSAIRDVCGFRQLPACPSQRLPHPDTGIRHSFSTFDSEGHIQHRLVRHLGYVLRVDSPDSFLLLAVVTTFEGELKSMSTQYLAGLHVVEI